MSYNNEVTYHEKWDTEENRSYQDQLEKWYKITPCSSHIPFSWSKEVLEMLETIDKEVGIKRANPWFKPDWKRDLTKAWEWTFGELPLYVQHRNKEVVTFIEGLDQFWTELKFRFWSVPRMIKLLIERSISYYPNRIRDILHGSLVELDQIKEKFGTLRVYITAPKAIGEYVDEQTRKCEVLLAQKGAYYTIDQMWNWGTCWWTEDYELKDIENQTKKDIKHFNYRQIMRDLGYVPQIDPQTKNVYVTHLVPQNKKI